MVSRVEGLRSPHHRAARRVTPTRWCDRKVIPPGGCYTQRKDRTCLCHCRGSYACTPSGSRASRQSTSSPCASRSRLGTTSHEAYPRHPTRRNPAPSGGGGRSDAPAHGCRPTVAVHPVPTMGILPHHARPSEDGRVQMFDVPRTGVTRRITSRGLDAAYPLVLSYWHG